MDYRYRGPKDKDFAITAAQFLQATGGRTQRSQRAALISMDGVLTKFLRHHPLSQANDHNVLIQGCYGIGSAALAFQLELLMAQGIETFVTIGTAGSLSSELPTATPVLLEKALIDEGVSTHYGTSSGDWSLAHPDILRRFSSHFKVVASWTTDAPFRESKQEINYYETLGIQTVEMEASALYSVAAAGGARAVAIAVISDQVRASRWEPKLQAPEVREALERTAVEVFKLMVSEYS